MTNAAPLSQDTETRIQATRARYRMDTSLADLLDDRARRRASGIRATGRPSLEDVNEQLQRFISKQVDTAFAIEDFARLSGGGANESYAFTFRHRGETSRRVLRIKARGGCTENHIQQEFEALRAIKETLPVPAPYWVANDHEHFGAPALVCDFVPGVQAPPSDVVKATGIGIAYGPKLAAQLGPQFARYEGMLHGFDWRDCALPAFDLPRPGTTDAIDWRLAYWDRAWDEDKLEDHPTVLLTRDWLWRNRPVVDHVSLLHGDYRNGNFLFDLETAQITSVLDWELCALGDRHQDLAYTMLRDYGHLDENGTFLIGGLIDQPAFTQHYEAASGLKIDPVRLHYYAVYNYYWIVVALLATGPRNSAEGLTQLSVMYNFISGLGAAAIGELNRLLSGARA